MSPTTINSPIGGPTHPTTVMPPVPMNDLRRTSRDPEILAALRRVTDRGVFVNGPEVAGFESDFADFVGTRHCVGVGNGSDALILALRALGIGPGHRVATAANAGFYASGAILSAGATPELIDIDPATHLMDPVSLAAALGPPTRSRARIGGPDAVILTHLYGDASAAPAIAALCAAAGVPLIEDCAQAAGALIGGRRAGSVGLLSAFSFFPTKNLAALGDAGAVLTDAPDLAQRVRRLAQHGWASRFAAAEVSGNSRTDELQAAVLRSRLPHLDADNARRRDIWQTYETALRTAPPESTPVPRATGHIGGVRMVGAADGEHHVAHLAVVVTADAACFRAHLHARGIATDVHYPIPDHRQAAWPAASRATRPTVLADLPVTDAVTGTHVSIPCFPAMADAEVARVADAIASAGRHA